METKIKLLSNNVYSIKKSPKLMYLFLDSKNDTSNAYNLLQENIKYIRKKFKLIVKYKETQNKNILKFQREVILLKKKYLLNFNAFRKEYINTSDIINEESKEYNTKTDVFTIENSNDNSKNFKSKYLGENYFYKNNLVNINKDIEIKVN